MYLLKLILFIRDLKQVKYGEFILHQSLIRVSLEFHNQDFSICLLYGYLDSSYVHLFVTY